jgi:hypothetical protein
MTYFIAFILKDKFERAYLLRYNENSDTIEIIEERRLKNNPYGDVYITVTLPTQYFIYENNVPKLQFKNKPYINGYEANFYIFKLLHKHDWHWSIDPELLFEIVIERYFNNSQQKPKYYIIFDDRPKYKYIYVIEPLTKYDFMNIIKEYEALALWYSI